jgi:CHAT domain-containing protein
MKWIHVRTALFFILNVILFSFQLSFAQTRPNHWLVGQWDGKIEKYLPKENPARTLQVFAVLSDGTARGRWAITGQDTARADVKVQGEQVNIVTGKESQVVLRRERDDRLVGTFTLQKGRNFRITLTKNTVAKPVEEEWTALEAEARQAEKEAKWSRASNFYRLASNAARERGQFQRAIGYGNKSLETAEKANDPALRAYAMLQLAYAYRRVGQKAATRNLLERGLEILKQIPSENEKTNLESLLYRELGGDYTRTGEHERAIPYILHSLETLDSRLAVLRRNPETNRQTIGAIQRNMPRTLELLGDAYSGAGKIEEAVKAYERGLELNKDFGLTTTTARIYLGLGRLYLRRKEVPRAIENLQKALGFAESLGYPQVIQLASSQMGNLLREANRNSEAISYYEKAIASIELTRSQLESEEFRSGFFESTLTTYANIIRAHLDQKSVGEAFNYNERARSRAFLDVLGSKVQLARSGTILEHERALQARIGVLRAMMEAEEADPEQARRLRKELAEAQQDYNEFLAKVRKENKEQASLMNVEPLALKQVQELLDPEVTMLEYFVVGGSVYLWVVEKDRLRYVNIRLNRKDLVSKVTSLRDTIYQISEKERFDALSRELYRLLIEPALPHIRGKELLIVPHDVLHYLPFQTLLSPQGKFLIQDYPLYYISSASLLQFTKEKRRAGKGDKVLALGNPDLGDPRMNLQFAELEAKEIQGLYPQSTVLLKREATEEKTKTFSPQNDIIHFATHAELSEEDPLSSAILLAKAGKEDGRLEVREIFGMDLKANLVVLSACETGLGKLSSGDELVGLTRAFIYAGTPSVVASLWNVEDSSTAALMASFYKNLKTMSKVEALRQAQLQLIRGEARSDLLARRGIGGVGKLGEVPAPNSQSLTPIPASIPTSHPYFWAPFILVGDGK